MLARVRTHIELKRARDRLKVDNAWLESEISLREHENQVIQDVSIRGFHRVLRVARSVADLDGARSIALPHLAEAIQYRRVLGVG